MLRRSFKASSPKDPSKASSPTDTLRWYGKYLPLRWTSQEKWFLIESTKRTDKVTIITAPRGYRKSWTAQRVRIRGSFLRPWCQFEYITSESFAAFEKNPHRSVFATLRDDFLMLMVCAVIAGGFAAIYVAWVQSCSATDAMNAAWSEVPSLWTGLAILVCTLCAAKLRVRVLIFDDVTRIGVDPKVPASVITIRNRLNYISGFELDNRVVIVSSNEALHHCYSDINPTVRITKSMPPATPQELLQALKECDCPMTLDELKVCQSKTLEHHGNSIRFFNQLMKSHADSLKDLKAGRCDVSIPSHRAALWGIVNCLDLQCEVTLAAATLCMCPVVSLQASAAKMGFNLPLTSDRDVPRRLALAYLMAMSSPDTAPSEWTNAEVLAERKALTDALSVAMTTMTSVKASELRPGVKSATAEYMLPLVAILQQKLGLAVLADADNFVCFVRVMLPGGKVITTDVACTLVEKKLPRTVDGLMQALLQHSRTGPELQGKDHLLKVFAPGKDVRSEPCDEATPLVEAQRNAPYQVTLMPIDLAEKSSS